MFQLNIHQYAEIEIKRKCHLRNLTMSPLLFNKFIEKSMEKFKSETKRSENKCRTNKYGRRKVCG